MSLTGQDPGNSYEQILILDNDGGGSGSTLLPIKDGDGGTTFSLSLSNNASSVNAGDNFYLDGGSNTYLSTAGTSTAAADSLNVVTGGSTRMNFHGQGFYYNTGSFINTSYDDLGVLHTGDSNFFLRSSIAGTQRILFIEGSSNKWGVYHDNSEESGALVFENYNVIGGGGGKMKLTYDGELYLSEP